MATTEVTTRADGVTLGRCDSEGAHLPGVPCRLPLRLLALSKAASAPEPVLESRYRLELLVGSLTVPAPDSRRHPLLGLPGRDPVEVWPGSHVLQGHAVTGRTCR